MLPTTIFSRRRLLIILAAVFVGSCFTGPAVRAQSAQQHNEIKGKGADPYSYVSQMPEYPGGIAALKEFLVKNIHYPDSARKNNVEGKVVTRFIVETDGHIENAEVLRSVDPLLDAEALRVVKSMPLWKPGMEKGEPVRVYYTLPIGFRLK